MAQDDMLRLPVRGVTKLRVLAGFVHEVSPFLEPVEMECVALVLGSIVIHQNTLQSNSQFWKLSWVSRDVMLEIEAKDEK